ncbi:hypothetical protein [Rhizobium sp.]|uniref:hypothetical protein n=1 Tax=Rhizobium sp. TaxID=391 RepID=UPI0028AF3818
MLTKFVNAFRPSVADVEGTGTYPDGLFAAALANQLKFGAASGLRTSYEKDYLAAKKLNEPLRPHS